MPEIVTEMPNLQGATIANLDSDVISAVLRRQLRDIDRPRTNMGGSGPPGYAGYDHSESSESEEAKKVTE